MILFCPDLTGKEEVKAMFIGNGDFVRPVLNPCIKEKCVAYKDGKCLKYNNEVGWKQMNALDKIVEEIESMKNDVYETLKEEKKRHGASKTAEELESYIYGLTCAVDIVEEYVDKENVE